MSEEYTIRQAARMVGVTCETLRHYDRIGLVPPARRDEWTGYRYYSRAQIVRLSTICALRRMDIPLEEIASALEMDDLQAVVRFFERAEQRAEEKIARLRYAKEQIERARAAYQDKLRAPEGEDAPFVRNLPERVILLSDTLREPTLDNLWSYQSSFYAQLSEQEREHFAFEDLAGILHRDGDARLFAVCLCHCERPGLEVLPAGEYLCANCEERDRRAVLDGLLERARERRGESGQIAVEIVVVCGILQWKYQAQVYLGPARGA